MKRQFILLVLMASLFLFASCNDKEEKKEEPGVKIEGKNGGNLEINKDKLQIEGSKGGELKMDSNGVKIKGKSDNK